MKVLLILSLLWSLASCNKPREEEDIDYSEMVMAAPEEEWTTTLEGKAIASDIGPEAQEIGNPDFDGSTSIQ